MSRALYYLSKASLPILENTVDVVLSPEFYWAKGVNVPSSNKRQLKAMAPSIFAGALPKGEYRYLVYPVGKERWVVVAYDKKAILNELVKLGVATRKIAKVYLAQALYVKLKETVAKVGEEHLVSVLDGVVCQVRNPQDESTFVQIETLVDVKSMSEPIDLGSMQDKVMKPSSFYQLALLALTVLCVYGLSLWPNLAKTQRLARDKAALLDRGLPQTSFERASILTPLYQKEAERQKVEATLLLTQRLSTPYKKQLVSIAYDKKTLTLYFEPTLKNRSGLQKELADSGKRIDFEEKDGQTIVKVGS